MEVSPVWKDSFLQILREELIPAMGCTEPIAIAYGAARAREVLGCLPEEVLVEASGNLIKNVKSVIVPNTNGLSGIEAAVAAGLIAGRPEKRLEVISAVTDEEKRQIAAYLEKNCIQVRPAQSELTFDLLLTLRTAEHCVKLRIAENHTNIVLIEKDGVVLQRQDAATSQPANLTDRSCLSVERILAFAEQVELEAVEPLIQRQLRMNLAIAEEGLRRDWGANIGSVLLRHNGDGVKNRAKAMAAAGSDARMSGCELPVCIVSRQRQSGHHGVRPSGGLCEGTERWGGKDDSGGASVRSADDPSEDGHRAALGVLRRGERGLRRRRGDRVAAWRRICGDRAYAGKRVGDHVRHRVRRREAVLRGEDRHGGGDGHPGL